MSFWKCENDTRKYFEIVLRDVGIIFSCHVSCGEGLPRPEAGSGSFYGVCTCPKGWKPEPSSSYEFIQKWISPRDTRTRYLFFFFCIFFCLFVSCQRFLSLFELNVTARCHSEPGLFIVESSSTSTFKVSSAELKAQLFWSGNGKGLFWNKQ